MLIGIRSIDHPGDVERGICVFIADCVLLRALGRESNRRLTETTHNICNETAGAHELAAVQAADYVSIVGSDPISELTDCR